MKEYVKPTLEAVELRLEERVACCDRSRGKGKVKGKGKPHKHGGPPDNNEYSPSSS